MAAYQVTLPQCTYLIKSCKENTQCPLPATYIVLAPPMVAQRQPTPIWLEGETRTRSKASHRPTPTHCREHAYALCALPCPTLTTTP
jgi:hypothetical protein